MADARRESAQWWWRQRAEWSVDNWSYVGAVYVDGQVVGVQDMLAAHFAQVRSVTTGSWLGRRHQGQGLGKEMRQAILHLAFAGLGAEEALSGAGAQRGLRRQCALARDVALPSAMWTTASSAPPDVDGVGRQINLRMDRQRWSTARRDDIALSGLEGCLEMFIGTRRVRASLRRLRLVLRGHDVETMSEAGYFEEPAYG